MSTPSAAARILLLDDRFDPMDRERPGGWPGPGHAGVVCLFYLDPVLRRRLAWQCPCHGLEAVVGSEAAWGEAALTLARRFVATGPRWAADIEGIVDDTSESWRIYLLEALYRELHAYALLLALARFGERLRSELGVEKLVFEGVLVATEQRLFEAILLDHPGIEYRPGKGQPQRRTSPWSRLTSRLQEARRTGGLLAELRELAEATDRTFALRRRVGPWLRRLPRPFFAYRSASRGAIVLLSAYRNNTANLLAHAAPLERAAEEHDLSLHWLLINASAARPLPRDERRRSWLWSEPSVDERRPDERSPVERRPVEPGPVEQVRSVAESGEARDEDLPPGWATWREQSPTVTSWHRHQQYLARNLTRCFEAFLRRVRPRLLVVANPFSIEGWLARVARRHGVPVVQVMHGVLGGHLYTRTAIEADLLVTYGDFWRSLWPEEERGKIVVYRPEKTTTVTTARRSPASPRRLTFFSWDLAPLWGYPAAQFRARLGDFFHLLLRGETPLGNGVELTIRLHPLEDPHPWIVHLVARFGTLAPERLTIEKGSPLERTLEHTDVALMFRSTLMLECLARSIPVVMPGWIDFVFNRELAETPGLHLAEDSADLEDRIVRWLAEPPVIDPRDGETIVAPPGHGAERLGARLRRLLGGGDGS